MMKSMLSLTLIAAMAGSAPPAIAQGQPAAAALLARSITREAARLAAASSPGTPAESNWSRVVTVASGAPVVVTVRGSKLHRGAFVQADETSLIVRTGRWPVAQTIARTDIQEIRAGASGKKRALGVLVGFGAAMGGAVVGAAVGGLGSDTEDLRGSTLGTTAGLVGGAVVGYRAVTRTRGELIYRDTQSPP